MNIPDEAIEAAAALIATIDYPGYEPDRVFAREVLEAAAPHILAQVLQIADRLETTELTGDRYQEGRASGFRIAAEHIRQAVSSHGGQA